MDRIQYIIKADTQYRDTVQSILKNGIVAYSNGLNFEEYQKSKGEKFRLISEGEHDEFQRIYRKSLISEFTEITEDKYYEMMNVLPPTRCHNYRGAEIFFVSECYTLDLYSCFIMANDKYYSALRPIGEPSEELTAFLRD